MSKINLEGKIPGREKDPSSHSVKTTEKISIEELVERIRNKTQQIRTKKARNSGF